MTRIFVIPGHGAGDSGAVGNGYQEQERVRALATRIKALGGDSVTLADFSRNYYADNGISSLSIPSDTQIIELHMDSFGSSSPHGGHVIIKPSFSPDDYDNKLASFIASMFPGRSEKLTKQQLANADRAAAKGYGYRLLECCFITNASDVAKFNSNMDDLARGILAAFGIAASGSSGSSGSSESFGGTYRCTVDELNVRDAPSLSGNVVASYSKGQTVVLDDWYKIADGWVWGRYTGASSGKKRYIAVGKPTGGYDPSDYLVKV